MNSITSSTARTIVDSSLQTVEKVVEIEDLAIPQPPLRRSGRERNVSCRQNTGVGVEQYIPSWYHQTLIVNLFYGTTCRFIQRIPTSSLPRFRSLFWDSDDRYCNTKHLQVALIPSDNDDDDEIDKHFPESLENSKKRPRVESDYNSDRHSTVDTHYSTELVSTPVTPFFPIPVSQSSVETDVALFERNQVQRQHQQQQVQQYQHPQRWWPKRLLLDKAYDSPHIYTVDNFLTLSQLEYLHHRIQQEERQQQQKAKKGKQHGVDNGWQRSFCDTDQGTIVIDDLHRTSSFLSLPKQSDRVIRDIERTAAELFGIHVQQVEALQLVRYRPGEFFGLHHDLGELVTTDEDGEQEAGVVDHASSSSVSLPPKSIYGIPRRVATLFCYLNTLPPQCGGATYFPLCGGLQFQPRAGRAVLFCNITPQGLPEPKTIHAGQPVLTVATRTTREVSSCDNWDDSSPQVNHDTGPPTERKIASCDDCVQKVMEQQPEMASNEVSAMNVKYGLNIWACEA